MVRWMMKKWGTMAVKEGHVERERWEARNKKEKEASGRRRLEGNGQGDCIRNYTLHTPHTNILSLFREL